MVDCLHIVDLPGLHLSSGLREIWELSKVNERSVFEDVLLPGLEDASH